MHVLLSNNMPQNAQAKACATPKTWSPPKGHPISSPRRQPSRILQQRLGGLASQGGRPRTRAVACQMRGNWPYSNAYFFLWYQRISPMNVFFLLEDCKYPIFKCLFLRWRISNNWMVPANYKSLKLAQPLKLYSSSTLTEENTLVFTNSRLVSIHVWTNKIRTSSFMGKTSIAISVFGTVLSLSLYIYTV